jgi:hypothetical protein
LKCKPNDIQTNDFNIQVGPLWETNTNPLFILNPYITIAYCISYLTKIDKFVTREMQIILENCKHEEIKAFKQIRSF